LKITPKEKSNSQEKNKTEMEFPVREFGPQEKIKGKIEFIRREIDPKKSDLKTINKVVPCSFV
jgi:hypothetical protein